MCLVARRVSRIRHQNANHNLNRHVVNPPREPRHHPANGQSDNHTTADQKYQPTAAQQSQGGSDREPSAAAQVLQTSLQTRAEAETLPPRSVCQHHRSSAHQPDTSTIDVGHEDHVSPHPSTRCSNPPLAFSPPRASYPAASQVYFPTLRISYVVRSILFCTSAIDFIAERRSAQCRCLIS
jgi:hypothetical protein